MRVLVRCLKMVAAIGLFAGGNSLAADIEAGRQLAMQGGGEGTLPCMSCHGPDGAGNADAAFPRIAGMNAEYIVRQLHAYQEGTRGGPIMKPIVAKLSDTDFENVAAYYASLDAPDIAAPEADPALLEEGEWLATNGNWENEVPPCISCHGPGGRGVGAEFPAIAGQHASYIAAQLKAWQNGERRNDPQNLMKVVAERMSEREIEAAAAYFAAQSPTAE